MAASTVSPDDSKVFSCSNCEFQIDYHYIGKRPALSKHILLHEDCYVLKDPFSTTSGFISVGAMCSMCQKPTCMSTDCSLYYTRRFCLNCAEKSLHEFPLELQRFIKFCIQQEISNKKKGES